MMSIEIPDDSLSLKARSGIFNDSQPLTASTEIPDDLLSLKAGNENPDDSQSPTASEKAKVF
ncbi:hypothetical protein IBT49_19480 [Erwinia sp. S63]|nr:hypothetical protein [Erwinia sp. S63]